MSRGPVSEWTAEQVRSGDLPKIDLIKFSHDNAGRSFLNERRVLGNIKNVAKTAKKEQLVDAIMSRLSAKGLKPRRLEEVTKQVKAVKINQKTKGMAEVVDQGPPKFINVNAKER
ncbi:peptidyl-prolyl cis-trans isomerase FKBP3-like isoform X1 [Stigmatopora argus]